MGGAQTVYVPRLAAASPLRGADPRAKLVLSTCASVAVMLPLDRLAVFVALYAVLLGWARLLPTAARQVWRLRWLLIVLFVVDWVVVDLELAVLVTLRLVLLAGVFSLFVATTTPDEFRLALEALCIPYRYAFSLSLAFQSINLLAQEWRSIGEAQRARGALPTVQSARDLLPQLQGWVALTVPAIVMTTRRAWGMTEAACARGFDAPHRRPYRQLRMRWLDWTLAVGIVAVVGVLVFWPA